jgi:hypothetical protein
MKTNSFSLILMLLVASFGCGNANTTDTPQADPTALFVNKWWCDLNKKTASQYFKSDGSWEQGSQGGRFNDTGRWLLSGDKKKLVISGIKDSSGRSKTSWEYDIRSATENKLLLNFTAVNLAMDMEVCK